MNGIRMFFLNPNVHGIFALITQIASAIPVLAPYSAILSTIAGTLTATTVLLPESGSLHKQDYANIAGAVATSLKPPVETTQGRA